MAPEVIEQKEHDPLLADIWSLGCTIVEMAMGTPWPQLAQELVDQSNQAAMFHIANQPIVPEIPLHFSDTGKDLLSHCLHRSPSMRSTSSDLLQHDWFKD